MNKPTDTEMLDWLERQGSFYKWETSKSLDGSFRLRRSTSSGHGTAREAIAAAMEKEARK